MMSVGRGRPLQSALSFEGFVTPAEVRRQRYIYLPFAVPPGKMSSGTFVPISPLATSMIVPSPP